MCVRLIISKHYIFEFYSFFQTFFDEKMLFLYGLIKSAVERFFIPFINWVAQVAQLTPLFNSLYSFTCAMCDKSHLHKLHRE